MSKSLALLLTAIPATQAAWKWNKGTNVCAGIIVPCTDAASCSTVAVGPCEGAATEPKVTLGKDLLEILEHVYVFHVVMSKDLCKVADHFNIRVVMAFLQVGD